MVLKAKFAFSLALTPAILSPPAQAHHSFTATYLADKTVILDGTLSQFLFRNPHCSLLVDVKDSAGQVARWSIEWSGVGVLAESGINRSTLKPGDHVVVVANPSRYPDEHRARMISITRPQDGWKWSAAKTSATLGGR